VSVVEDHTACVFRDCRILAKSSYQFRHVRPSVHIY